MLYTLFVALLGVAGLCIVFLGTIAAFLWLDSRDWYNKG